MKCLWRMLRLFSIVALALVLSAQTEEQEEDIERLWKWRSTGRPFTEEEKQHWTQRIEMLQISDVRGCASVRTGVLTALESDRLGWATGRNFVTGGHYAGGPFSEDHWIIVARTDESIGRTETRVLRTLIHEAIHHQLRGITRRPHDDRFHRFMNCFIIDSGW